MSINDEDELIEYVPKLEEDESEQDIPEEDEDELTLPELPGIGYTEPVEEEEVDESSESDIMDVNYEDIFMGMIDAHIRERNRDQIVQVVPEHIGLSVSTAIHDTLSVSGNGEKTDSVNEEVEMNEDIFEKDDKDNEEKE